MDYVNKYLRLEDRIIGTETKAEEYRQRANDDRWEQARIAYEAVEAGEYDRQTFAKKVGKSNQVIGRQCRYWETIGLPISASGNDLPIYVISTVDGSDESARKQEANAAAVMSEPESAKRVLKKNPTAQAVTSEAVAQLHREEGPVAEPPRRVDPAIEFHNAETDVRVGCKALIEHANDARRSGFIKPNELRDIAEWLRFTADALDEIAGSRGITDEALYAWIGEEEDVA